MKSLNIIQRIFAETPPFWRAVQIICLVISLIIDHLSTAGYVSHSVQLLLDGGLGVGAALSQLAVTDAGQVKELLADPAKALILVPGMAAQLEEILKAFKNPAPVTLGSILEAAAQPAPGIQENSDLPPVVTAPPVVATDPGSAAPVYTPNLNG